MDKIQIKSKPNTQTGEVGYDYYYNGMQCPTHLIKEPISKKYIVYLLIAKDLEDAERWLTLAYKLRPPIKTKLSPNKKTYTYIRLDEEDIKEHKNYFIAKSLFFSSIVFYGKCFTKAQGRGTSLSKSFVPPEYHDKHDEIMEYRNTLAAHSGKGPWDTGKVRLVLPPLKGSGPGPVLKGEVRRFDFEDDRLDDFPFLKLIEILREKAVAKMDEVGKKIFKDVVLCKGEEYWYRSAPKKPKRLRSRNPKFSKTRHVTT